jgi:septum formation protein
LLARLIEEFEVVPAAIEESPQGEQDPGRLTVRLAREKASVVASRRPSALVIGADTLAFCDGELIGKPADRDDAIRILTKLTRGDHRVVTGLCLCAPDGRELSDAVSTRVVMKALPRSRIEELAHLPGALQAAGAYRLQPDDTNVDHLEGSETNVMGLPLTRLRQMLRDLYPACEEIP